MQNMYTSMKNSETCKNTCINTTKNVNVNMNTISYIRVQNLLELYY